MTRKILGEVSQHHEGGPVGTTESPEQQEGMFERGVQEEHRGQHESIRLQSEDHAWRVCTPRSKKRGQTWKMRTLRVTYSMPRFCGVMEEPCLSNTRLVAKTR